MAVKRLTGNGTSGRTNDPERTRANILEVASRHFAEHGLSGGRIDDIAEETQTSKRMIYYYFGGKDGLYEAVLERAYLEIRRIELEIDIPSIDPIDALRQIMEFTFDHQHRNPWFARLVAIENIHRAEHLKHIAGIRERNASIIDQLSRLLDLGVERGLFRAGINPVDLHWMISSFAIFNVVSQHTFSYLFPQPLSESEIQQERRAVAVESVLKWCRAE